MTSANKALAIQGFHIKDNIVVACNGLGFKNLLQAGKQWLETHVNLVNSLNVFPVPDGDTGTNMVLTMHSAIEKMAEAPGHDVAAIANAAAYGALMGGRGNSGVILSQFLQGLAGRLAGQATFTAQDFAAATQLGVEQAYKSVVEPVEGTILTVARAAAEAARQSAETNSDLVMVLTHVVQAAKAAQASTPELLPVLKEAGVTDSGGQGLVYILEGALRFMNNQPLDVDPLGQTAIRSPGIPILHNPQSTIHNPQSAIRSPGIPFRNPQSAFRNCMPENEEAYGYDVQFLIQDDHLNVAEIRAYIDRVGWSTLVVGDEHLVKVHVHTSDPGLPISYGASQGIIRDVVVENMDEQAKEFLPVPSREGLGRPEPVPPRGGLGGPVPPSGGLGGPEPVPSREGPGRPEPVPPSGGLGGPVPPSGIVSVVAGQGLARIFQSLGVSQVLPAMNPSPQELLDAVNRINADNVLILPNNDNVILAAQQAETLSEKRVKLVPTKTIPQGIAALLSFNYQVDLETNARRMLDAARQVQTVEITQAVRNSTFNGFNIKVGEVIGLFDNELISVGQDGHGVVLDILTKLEIDTYEIITIYFGQDSSPGQAEALARKINTLYPEIEIETHYGGQPHYHYIISLE